MLETKSRSEVTPAQKEQVGPFSPMEGPGKGDDGLPKELKGTLGTAVLQDAASFSILPPVLAEHGQSFPSVWISVMRGFLKVGMVFFSLTNSWWALL